MKKHFLSIPILFLIACNNPQTTSTTNAEIKPDSPLTLKDSPVMVKSYSIGSGLTLEEMKDDSVFADGSVPTSWEIAGITDIKGFKLFLKNIQALVLNDHKEELAKNIRYPLGRSIRNEQDFIKNYERLITKDVKLSIANINFSQVFRNNKGAMSEGGRLWFSQEANGFKIIAINS